MDTLAHPPGRPRQYPRCDRYGAHRFSPDTQRCPCGFQRPGTIPKLKESRKSGVVRISDKLLDALEEIAREQRVGVRELVESALSRFIRRWKR